LRATFDTANCRAEARGGPATTDRPYNESFAYDAFDHLTSRDTESWSKTRGFFSNDSYSNNRRTGWSYDAQGNLTDNLKRQYTYDAAGQTLVISWSGGSFSQVFDGDGKRIKTTDFGIATYYLESTVLGAVVSELDSTGAKQRGFVYAGGKVLAESGLIVHGEVSGVSVRKTDAHSGYTTIFEELDPMGADAYTEDPYLADPNYSGRGEGGPVYPGYGNIGDSSRDCTLDGVYYPCDMADRVLESGAALIGPENTTRYNYTKQRFEFFRAFADGYSGFLPADAVYAGGGRATRFSHFDYTSVTDEDGRTNGKFHPVFETIGVNDTAQNSITEKPFTEGDLDAMRAQIKKILAGGRCARFLSRLLINAGAGDDPPVHKNILDLFDAVRKQGGFVSATLNSQGSSRGTAASQEQ